VQENKHIGISEFEMKKPILLIIGLMFIVMSMFVSATIDDYASRWKFDNDATDEESNFDLTKQGGTYETDVKVDGTHSYLANANDEYLTHTTLLDTAQSTYTNGMTFAFWIRFVGTGIQRSILWKRNKNSPQNNIQIYTDANDKINFGAILDGTSAVITTTNSFSVNTWYHIVLVWAANGDTYLYQDKILQDSDTTTHASIMSDGTYADFELGDSLLGDPNEYFDDMRLYNRNISPEEVSDLYDSYFADTTPPTNSTWNVTSQNLPAGENSSIWNAGGQYVINVTNNTLSLTVTTDEASNGSCAIGKNWNYTTMIADNANYKFATTETTSHSYLVYDDIPIGSSCLYCSFIDASGNEFANSSSGCLNITRTTPITGYVFDDLTNIIEGAIVYITNLFTNIVECMNQVKVMRKEYI